MALTVEHPEPDGVGAVRVRGRTVALDGDTFTVPDAAESWVRAWADGYGLDYADVVQSEGTCQVVKESDGEVCGRDRPCPYHD